ncbi:MAG: bifunctional aspartate kinase/homoserine dehydrogenase I [Flavobacteriales bacterium]
MKVLKFGGTSVATADAIKKTTAIVKDKSSRHDVICVVSALGGVTNKLIEASKLAEKGDESYQEIVSHLEDRHFIAIRELLSIDKQSSLIANVKVMFNQLEDILNGVFLIRELTNKTSDFIVGFGEQLSSVIIATFMEAELLDSKELIKTNRNFGNAAVNFELTNENIKKAFKKGKLYVAPGFVSSTETGESTTLGRGGSDYTAAIYAAALDAEMLEIWTDVSGMMTADPRKVPSAFPIERISYLEAMELSHFGAKVIYPPTIQPALKKNISILIKNTFAPQDKGTLICPTADTDQPIKGITSIENISLVSLSGSGMIGIPGIASRLFGALAKEVVNVILITQSSSEHSITLAIDDASVEVAQKAVSKEFEYEISLGRIDELKVEKDMAIVALVGEKMSGQVGVSGKMMSALGSNGVSIRAIAQGSSERNISVVIEKVHVKKALNVLHERHFESENRKLNIFLVGVGNVGGTLIEQIKKQKDVLLKNAHIDVNVVGLANSKKMLLGDESGLSLDSWKEDVAAKGEAFDMKKFIATIKDLDLRNSVFVDVTANYDVAGVYAELLSNSISVVTANKVACSSEYDNYKKLKSLALKNRALFLFETNVGAGLPVIGTLNDMIASGDRINKIEGVVSGSLNFIFNSFNDKVKFHDIVKIAQKEGYTEPDPRIDLSGTDVKRKIVILIRESGYRMEMDEIKVESFLPQSCFDAKSVDDFFVELQKNEATFQKMYADANAAGKKLRVIGGYDGKTAFVKLEAVDSTHPFYNLQGKDNIVSFYTDRYAQQPLVIQGAGAGAEVTAAGVFADIIRVANRD